MKATFRDEDENLFDPVSHLITVKDFNGVEQIRITNPTRISLGSFKTTIALPSSGAIGVWSLWWVIVDSEGNVDMELHRFKVKKALI